MSAAITADPGGIAEKGEIQLSIARVSAIDIATLAVTSPRCCFILALRRLVCAFIRRESHVSSDGGAAFVDEYCVFSRLHVTDLLNSWILESPAIWDSEIRGQLSSCKPEFETTRTRLTPADCASRRGEIRTSSLARFSLETFSNTFFGISAANHSRRIMRSST